MNTEFESFENLIDTPLRIIQGTTFSFAFIIGSIFYWGIIKYEKYGGDPMKRSFQNRLLSAIAYSAILKYYTFNIGFAWRIQVGPLHENLSCLINFCADSVQMNGFLSFNEIMIYKVMAIYYWNQICNLDESFWAQFILLFNFGLTFVTHFSRWMLNSFEDERNGFFNGTFTDKQQNVFWPTFMSINLMIFLVCGLIIIYHKYKSQNDVISININPKFNNEKLNKPLVNNFYTTVMTMILLIPITISIISRFVSTSDYFTKFKLLCYTAATFQFIVYVLLPIIIMLRWIKFKTFLWREIKDFC